MNSFARESNATARFTLILAALGLATIYLLWIMKPVVSSSQRTYYHWSGSARTLFLPVALNVLVAWAILALLLQIARTPGRRRVVIWTSLLLLIPYAVLVDVAALFSLEPARKWSLIFLAADLVLTVLAATYWHRVAQRFEGVLQPMTTILVFMGLFGLFLLARISWFGGQAAVHEAHFTLRHAEGPPALHPQQRILWIVFDELSYQQTYEHRFPGLSLPAFDALAQDATVFSSVIPIEIRTEVVLPGLMTGKSLDDIATGSGNFLSLHDRTTGKWQDFDQHDTVLQDALTFGYSTSVAGWYNPYCRLLAEVLDRCFWTFQEHSVNALVSSGTVLSNSLEPFAHLESTLFDTGRRKLPRALANILKLPGTGVPTFQLQSADYKLLYDASLKLIRDPSATFILLHFPVPHPPGFSNRANGNLADETGSYIDNLALADRCLAGIREALQQQGQWDSTTLIVLGDHSWRTRQEWRTHAGWHHEDEVASQGGQYDARPAYIVKMAGQQTGTRVDTPFHAVNTRKLIDAIMAHTVQTPDQLTAWATSAK